jgi:transposase
MLITGKGVISVKKPLPIRQQVVAACLRGEITKQRAAFLLNCSPRTIQRYRRRFLALGVKGLTDHRHSNNYKLTGNEQLAIVNLKKHDPWRSARNIRDALEFPVSESSVSKLIRSAGLSKQNLKRVKPIIRFEAAHPNDLWQTDIMGRIDFPKIGILYLIATLDDYSRFVPDDFVREVWGAKTIDEVNGKFTVWLARYNWRFRSRAFAGQTRASRYRQSDRRVSRVELQTLLVVEERRKVTRQSTVSLYGHQYLIPPGYINCHIWVKVVGNKVLFEANNQVFWKTRLKTI